jgi:hypothetical protein
MSNHSELRDLRSEGICVKNKYKFTILKITLMPRIKEAFVWSNVNTKSTLQYTFEFCSDISFIGTLFSRNWHLLFVLTLLISDVTFVLLLLSSLVSVQSDISKTYFRIMSENNCSQKCATNYQTYFENQFNYFWAWNKKFLNEISQGDSAERIWIMWAQFSAQVFDTPRPTALKLFPETAFSSDHNNNLKWALLGMQKIF